MGVAILAQVTRHLRQVYGCGVAYDPGHGVNSLWCYEVGRAAGAGFAHKPLAMTHTPLMGPDGVPEWWWKTAQDRVGTYEILIPCYRCDVHPVLRLIWPWGRSRNLRVSFKAKEWTKLDTTFTNQVYSGAKKQVKEAITFQAARVVWPGDSPDEVAMRHIGPWAASMFLLQERYPCKLPWFAWLLAGLRGVTVLACIKWITQLLKMRRAAGVKSLPWFAICRAVIYASCSAFFDTSRFFRPRVTLDIKAKNVEGQIMSPATAGKGFMAQVRNALGYPAAGAEYVNEHPTGSIDESDGAIRAAQTGRIVEKECGIGVVGQVPNDRKRKKISGVVLLPTSTEPNVYAQHFENAEMAVKERIDKKTTKCNASPADREKIGNFIKRALGGGPCGIFGVTNIAEFIAGRLLADMCSKKWTAERFQQAIEKLCREIDPEFTFKASVKLEPMKEGKAPRLLIADEDMGQVMSLMTVYTIEGLIKQWYPNRGIKGVTKKEAMIRIQEEFKLSHRQAKKLGRSIFEGDGTAWDTKCSAKLRDMTENPIIKQVCRVITTFFDEPDQWLLAHERACTRPDLKLRYSKSMEKCEPKCVTMTIAAIRRSGHRGTSCLNWWTNFVCWMTAVFADGEAELFLNPDKRNAKDVMGINRWLVSAFEGDDSLLMTSPKIEAGDALHQQIIQYWERLGFEMKIFLREKSALFVGYRLAIDENGLMTGVHCPEIDRCFGGAGVSTSPASIEAFEKDDKKALLALAAAGALSRAYEFAGLIPTISNKFLEYAEKCKHEAGHIAQDHDLKMRLGVDPEETVDLGEMKDRIAVMNANFAAVDGEESFLPRHTSCPHGGEEDWMLERLEFEATPDELHAFSLRTWDYSILKEWGDFAESLPETWRK